MRGTKIAALPLFASVLLLLTACASPSATRTAFAMDTAVTLTAYGAAAEQAMDAALAILFEAEGLWSTTLPDSTVSRLNRDGTAVLDARTAELLACALGFAARTDGAFDPTVCPMVRAWGFTTGAYRVPDPAELADLRARGNYRDVMLAGGVATLGSGMALDFGAIAKGYSADVMADVMRSRGVTSGLISLGGNVRALGAKPDGSPWRVGIRDPERPDRLVGVVSVRDLSVVTSGGYERFFVRDGMRYHHILDPGTGEPARSGLLSVTVISPDGALADALSTALFVMGLDRGLAFWREERDFEAIFVTEGGEIIATPGLEGVLSEPSAEYALRWADWS